MSGLSAPIVLVTFKPEGVHTNQAHPEPKAVRPERREGGRENEWGRDGEIVCVRQRVYVQCMCVHVCVREGLIMSVCERDTTSAFEKEYASKFPLLLWSSAFPVVISTSAYQHL